MVDSAVQVWYQDENSTRKAVYQGNAKRDKIWQQQVGERGSLVLLALGVSTWGPSLARALTLLGVGAAPPCNTGLSLDSKCYEVPRAQDTNRGVNCFKARLQASAMVAMEVT